MYVTSYLFLGMVTYYKSIFENFVQDQVRSTWGKVMLICNMFVAYTHRIKIPTMSKYFSQGKECHLSKRFHTFSQPSVKKILR